MWILITMIILLYISTIEVRDISGCEARGDANSLYLRRWVLYEGNSYKLYYHKFYRSDHDDLHDHPWDFISFIVWRGYVEQYFLAKTIAGHIYKQNIRIKPFTFIKRKAEHFHRVVLIDNKPAYTLVFTYNKHKSWGFLTKDGWVHWRNYFRSMACD